MRTDEEVVRQLANIRAAPTKAKRKELAMRYGINSETVTVLAQLPGMSHTQSYPHDGMDLLFENHVKNMIKFWKGTYGLDEGEEEYVIAEDVWKRIGVETTKATSTLPSAFVSALPNIDTDSSLYTAEMYSFWLIYIAPHVLKNRFRKTKYYNHMLELVAIIKMVLQFTITREEIQQLRFKIIGYVQRYEEYYYQYRPKRLTACRITVHALLHICDDIERTGPLWVNWCFVMERYCGLTVPAVKSKRKPYATLNLRNLHIAQLSQIVLRFNLKHLLQFEPPEGELSSHEYMHDACPDVILRFPRKVNYRPPPSIRNKIVVYFVTMFNCEAKTICNILPETCERWGNARIAGGGDVVRGKASLPDERRDNSFVKYVLQVDKNANNRRRQPEFIEQICYGQLDFIMVVTLPASPTLKLQNPTQHVIALVQTCKTSPVGGDAAKEVVFYSTSHPSTIINLRTIQCAVGRVHVRGMDKRWGIVDRTGDYARTIFVDEGEGDEG